MKMRDFYVLFLRKLITLNILHEVVPPGTHFTAESTEAMQIKYLAQGNNILLPGFEPSTSVTRNRHSNQYDDNKLTTTKNLLDEDV